MLNPLDAFAFQVSTRSCVAAGVRLDPAACSDASVAPRIGRKALHAHQLTTAVTATSIPLTVNLTVSERNSSRGAGRVTPIPCADHWSLSRTNKRAPNATTTGTNPARNT